MVTSTSRVNGLTVCGILAVGALTVGTAGASTMPIKYTGLDGSGSSVTVNTYDWPKYNSQTTRAGAMSFTQTDSRGNAIPDTSFTAYCIELEQSTSDRSRDYTVRTDVGNVIDDYDANAVAKLWQHYDAGNLTGNSATAFQLVVWNLVYDINGDYSLNSGLFKVSSMTNSVKTIAEDMLTWLECYSGNAPLATLTALTHCDYQNLITGETGSGNPPAVPEPATLAIGLLTVGCLGFTRRNRRSAR